MFTAHYKKTSLVIVACAFQKNVPQNKLTAIGPVKRLARESCMKVGQKRTRFSRRGKESANHQITCAKVWHCDNVWYFLRLAINLVLLQHRAHQMVRLKYRLIGISGEPEQQSKDFKLILRWRGGLGSFQRSDSMVISAFFKFSSNIDSVLEQANTKRSESSFEGSCSPPGNAFPKIF